MSDWLDRIYKAVGLQVSRYDAARAAGRRDFFAHREVYRKFQEFTMMPLLGYIDNLALAKRCRDLPGDVVECGVWRGGMIAGMAQILGCGKKYWLFDSFEGLPPAKTRDGEAAIRWQEKKDPANFHDNCSADQTFAIEAMLRAGSPPHQIVKGWFSETVPRAAVQQIALLRLDGDWYDSTMCCLEHLYPKVVAGGIVIIDDYHFWDGCSRAVHDYLSKHDIADRISQTHHGVAYIIKDHSINHFN